MWRARMETPNFEFVAYGRSKGEAMRVMRAGLVKHAHQYDTDKMWWARFGFEITVRYVAEGECYRNNELL